MACWMLLEVHFGFILRISRSWWPDGSHDVSGDSFLTFLGHCGKMAFRMSLEAHLKDFWVLVALWLSGCL